MTGKDILFFSLTGWLLASTAIYMGVNHFQADRMFLASSLFAMAIFTAARTATLQTEGK